jgi:hypothetical protein
MALEERAEAPWQIFAPAKNEFHLLGFAALTANLPWWL